MKIARSNEELHSILASFKQNNQSAVIGFVPTMGALHQGHISLIKSAKEQSDMVVCSVFVNPTQFNDASDLEKYPRQEKKDIDLLEKNECDVLFLPQVQDIYPNGVPDYQINLDGLDQVMEGKFRTGHFEGVCMVVERLFRLVNPNKAFFGIKDFQQVSIINYMVKVRKLDVQIIACPIKRDENGLALSSRNQRLNEDEKKAALILFSTISVGKQAFIDGKSVKEAYQLMSDEFNKGSLKLEYLEIVDNSTLQEVDTFNENQSICIAAYCGEVRLIDNIQLGKYS